MKRIRVLLVMFVVLSAFPFGLRAATFDVSNLNDTGAGSLRQALADATASGTDDTITFSTNGTIALTSAEISYTAAQSLTITGNGEANTVLSGGGTQRILDFGATAGNITIEQLTIKDGRRTDNLGGAGIHWENNNIVGSTLTLTYVTIKNCQSDDGFSGGGSLSDGGALLVSADIAAGYLTTLVVEHCTFDGNRTGDNGGAIWVDDNTTYGATVTISDSTFRNNSAWDDGAALYLENSMSTISRCTIHANTNTDLGSRGAIHIQGGEAALINCTISDNQTVDDGGGIAGSSAAVIRLDNCTVTGNRTTDSLEEGGGGFYVNNSTIVLHNTIVIGNTSASGFGDDGLAANLFIGSGIESQDYNLTGTATLSWNFLGAKANDLTAASAAAVLNPFLADNGGPVQTHALFVGSPAIAAAELTGIGGTATGGALLMDNATKLRVDARGFARAQGVQRGDSAPDIGAYEFSATLPHLAPAAPEIDIQRPASTSIADGGTDNLGTQSTGTVSLTYTVDNSAGAAALQISTVTASGFSNVSGFTGPATTPFSVPAAGSTNFSVEFDVDAVGAFGLNLAIGNDDADESPYNIAISGTGTIIASQTITFSNPGGQLTTNETSIAATASSGLPVSLSVLSGPATLSTNIAPATATYSATGQVSIVATQAGNGSFSAAPAITNTFAVSATPQAALVFNPTSPQTYNTTNTLSTTGGSGTGTVSYAVLSGPAVITNTTGLYATSGTGSIVVQATKAADALYLAQSASATVTVQKASQTITLEMLGVQVTTNVAAFVQVASDIDGEAAGDSSGFSVSFSTDGNRVAIGALANAGNGADSGHVRVYDFSGTNWVQVGSDIDAEATGDQSGRSVSLSADGSRLAISATSNGGNGFISGHVRVFEFNGSNWVQLGADIDGEASGDRFGVQVSLSDDGSRVGVGAPYNDGNGSSSGHVRVFEFNGSNWVQLGADIDGEAAGDQSGSSVSLSADGSRVGVGAPYNDGNGSSSGHIRVYDLSGTNWVQVGSDIEGEAAGDWSGYSVSLSADGSRAAIGAVFNGGNGSGSGHVRVYDFSGTNWVQVGSDIDGEAASDLSGETVSLSADGNRVAIGAVANDGNGSLSGHVRVFEFSGSNWVQLGADIDGEAAGDQSGNSVSLTADGNRVAIGAKYNDGNGSDSGHVRVYAMTPLSLTYSCLTTNTVALSATSDSGLAVTNVTATVPGSISGGSNLTFSTSGTVYVAAFQLGDSNYNAAVPVTNAITVLPATQSALVFNPTSPQTYNTTNALSVTGGSGTGTVSYAVLSGPGVITNTTGLYATSGTGSIVVQATKAADVLYQSQSASATVTVQKASQAISFSNPGAQLTTNETSIAVTAGSGLPVSLSVQSGPAMLSTNIAPSTATYSATGQVSIVATQAGNSNWAAAPGVTNTFTVSATPQATLVFNPTSPQTYNTTNALSTIGGSGTGAVSYAVLSGPGVITNTTGLYATSGTGSIVLQATKAADARFQSQTASATVTVQKATQAITLEMFGVQVTTNAAGFVQVGLDIDGEAAGDNSGYSVSFSADGSRVAIGASRNAGNGSNAGHVRVYDLSGTNWLQVGADIDGEAVGDQSGRSVSLSADGSRVAIGSPYNDDNGTYSGNVRVYGLSGTNWVQVGADIDGEAFGDNIGWSVSLSADGSRVAIGGPRNDGNGGDSGHVRVYGFSGINWVQVGSDIDGESLSDQSGWSVSLSANGNRVAIGAPYSDGNGSNSGHVRVYNFSGTNWIQVGLDIDGEAAGDNSGYAVSLSAAGSRVAIGAPSNDGNGTDSGHVRVYDLSGTNWVQVGSDIDGESLSDQSGWSVSLSSDGSRVAIGARLNDANGTDSGHVRVYGLSETNWLQVGLDIDGEAGSDNSGFSVSLSSDGSRVAIGATGNDGNGTDSGHVRMYELTQVSLAYSCLTTNTVALSATSDSGLPVTSFSATSPGTISGGSNLTFSATGTVSVAASQPGNANYSAAAVSNVITVLPATQAALVFSPTSPQTYNTTNTLSVTGGSGTGTVSYAVLSGPGVITNTTGIYATSGTGSIVVQATKAADALYQSQNVSATVTVQKAAQAISFASPGAQLTTNVTSIAATAGSGLPVSLSVQSGPATLSTNIAPATLSYSATGTVSIVATQIGDGNWQSASPVTNTFAVSATPQATLTFAPSSPQTYNTTNALSTTDGSGTGTVTYAVLSGPGVMTNSTGLYATSGTGAIVVQAIKAGDARYQSQSVSATVTVAKASQTISFSNPGTQFWTNQTAIAATAGSGLGVVFAVEGGPASLVNGTNGTTVTYGGYGSVSITASQAGNTNWQAAATVTNTFSVVGPQLVVLGTNGAVVASSNAVSLADGTHFGEAIIGLEPVTNVFTITNAGNGTLTMGTYETNGTHATSFRLMNVPDTVAVGTSAVFSVVFNPQIGGSNTAIFVFSFDGTNSPYTVNVAGVGLGGGISLATNTLSFSGSYQGSDPSAQWLTMNNVGVSSFSWTHSIAYSAGASNWLSVLPNAGTVATNGLTSLTNAVDLTGVSAGIHTATVSIVAADATNSPQTYAVSLTVAQAANTISFANPGLQIVTNQTPITATASSGLSVSLQAVSGPALIVNGTNGTYVTYTDPGMVTLRATQAGNANWQAASAVEVTYRVRADRVPYADFDGDGRSDTSVFWPEQGNWYIWQTSLGQSRTQNWGWDGSVPVPGDYDGDGQVDVAVYGPSDAMWHILQSSDWQVRQQPWGWSETQPVPADYDGDGKTDLAVYHQAEGNWYIIDSATATPRSVNWGWSETVPVPGDYDGDGKADLAVYYPAGGSWFILQSSNWQVRQQAWGWAQAQPVPEDYDGDGLTDLAVFDQANGMWYIIDSATATPRTVNWGWWATPPVPGDFDGDGKSDIAVYDPGSANWYIQRSTDGQMQTTAWGWQDPHPVWPAWR